MASHLMLVGRSASPLGCSYMIACESNESADTSVDVLKTRLPTERLDRAKDSFFPTHLIQALPFVFPCAYTPKIAR
jgi:hypothetical protein